MRRGERIDVLSTHSKYAPSQAAWLRPLDALVDADALAPTAVELCRFDGVLLRAAQRRRARALGRRRAASCPPTWAELASPRHASGFPGRESGLFGTFFELVAAHGGRLFDDALRPTIDGDVARRADTLSARAARTRRAARLALRRGRRRARRGPGRARGCVAGRHGALRGPRADLEPHPYLSGPLGLRSYAGCHAWAIPKTCGDLDGARARRALCAPPRRTARGRERRGVRARRRVAARCGRRRDRRAPPRDHPPRRSPMA